MFYIAVKVTNDDGETIAFAGCWIVDESMESAQQRAVDLIQSSNWHVSEIVQVNKTGRDNYDDDAEGLKYYKQALIDGEVCVVFTARR